MAMLTEPEAISTNLNQRCFPQKDTSAIIFFDYTAIL